MRLNQILLAVLAIALFGLTPAIAQDGQAPPADQRKKQFAAMAARSGQPTEQHKLLAPFVGHFDQVSAVKMGPGEPITFHAIGTGTWIMGSRFVRLDSTSAPDA